jgi:hypothetical protein
MAAIDRLLELEIQCKTTGSNDRLTLQRGLATIASLPSRTRTPTRA